MASSAVEGCFFFPQIFFSPVCECRTLLPLRPPRSPPPLQICVGKDEESDGFLRLSSGKRRGLVPATCLLEIWRRPVCLFRRRSLSKTKRILRMRVRSTCLPAYLPTCLHPSKKFWELEWTNDPVAGCFPGWESWWEGLQLRVLSSYSPCSNHQWHVLFVSFT